MANLVFSRSQKISQNSISAGRIDTRIEFSRVTSIRYPFAVSTRALSAPAWAVRLINSRSCSFSRRYTTRKSPSGALASARDLERSSVVRRVVKDSQAVEAGSRSQPRSRPAKKRMFRSVRTTGERISRLPFPPRSFSQQSQLTCDRALAVRKNSSRVMPARVPGRSMAHTS